MSVTALREYRETSRKGLCKGTGSDTAVVEGYCEHGLLILQDYKGCKVTLQLPYWTQQDMHPVLDKNPCVTLSSYTDVVFIAHIQCIQVVWFTPT